MSFAIRQRERRDGRVAKRSGGIFRPYTVDTARHVVSHHVDATLRAAEAGTIDRVYSFEGGNLSLTAKATRDGSPVTYILVWKRAAKP